MIWPFRPSARRILAKAQAEFNAAYAARIDAERRRDTRSMHSTAHRLRTARHALMAAQAAMNPAPRDRGVVA